MSETASKSDLTTHLIGAGAGLIAGIGSVLVRAVAGAFRSSEELRAALLEQTGALYAFAKPGGEMDQREASAVAKTDRAIAEEEARQLREEEARRARAGGIGAERLAGVPKPDDEEDTQP